MQVLQTQPTVVKYYPNGMQFLHTDGAGEFQNGDVVEHSQTCANTAQLSPFSGRVNRTLIQPTRGLLEQAGWEAKY